MQHISLLALPSCLTTSISLPLEILNAANELARIRNRKQAPLVIDIIGKNVGPITTAGGLSIMSTATPADIKQTDLLILPSLWRNPIATLRQHQWLLPWLIQMADQGSTICAVGTSSFFLAEAGLLNHKPATTHWYYFDTFEKHFPQVDLKRQHLITQAQTIFCAGSVNSIADLMVYLVTNHHGQKIARQVEAQFSPEIRRAFGEHAFLQRDNSPHNDEIIIEAQEYLQQNYQSPLSIASLADQLQLSPRSFNRRFKKAAGITASDYLQNHRLHVARELLRTSNLSISEIAAQSGYQDNSYFCQRFKMKMGQTPLSYRQSVRGKLFKII
ncbi:MAG: helix-turn-helix domain-containing protein [Oceanicoccus sp.]